MCGISAIVALSDTARDGRRFRGVDDEDALRREMEDSLQLIKHRGPDASGTWVNSDQRIGELVLGHNRLAINDLSPCGNQPLHSADNTTHAIVNGELYGHEKLKADLVQSTGYQFLSNCDSEIVLALYEAYGLRFLQYLKGEFSFCLYDSRKKLFIAARDRYGIKPLFWTIQKQRLLVAAEIKAFIPLGWRPEWDVQSLGEGGWNFDDRTLFKDVRKRIRDVRNESDIIQGVRDRLMEAVRVRLRADVPIGVYLSGGIDSSVIAGLATHLSKDLGTNIGSIPSEDRVTCFSVQFDETSGFDESDIAERTAEYLGVRLHKKHMNEEEIALRFEDATWHCEHHNRDLNYVGKFALSEVPRDLGFKVVLTGEGADEIFTGYPEFLSDVLREADMTWDSGLPENHRLSISNKAEVEANGGHGLIGAERAVQNMSDGRRKLNGIATVATMSASIPSSIFADWTANLDPVDPEDVIANDIRPNVIEKMQQKWHPINTAQYVWTKGHLANQLMSCLGDRTEMAHSIEGRTPFLDHQLTEYVNNIPPSLKVKWNRDKGFTAKYALREAMKSFVTPEVYERAKHPYGAPISYPVGGPLHKLLNTLLTEANVENLGFVSWNKVKTLLDRAFRKKEAVAGRLAIVVAQWVVLAQRFHIPTASQA
ncbi:MAG: hypothetical protein M1812_005654 [Candelaria pacifica]|nr:MAG: hypothetical protein M1812_005654 [Candelaria pacifica]